MKAHSRGVTGRIISFMLVMVMIMSMWSVGILPTAAADVDLSESSADLGEESLSSVGASGVSGDGSLFTEADSTAPYVKTEKSSFAIDTPVLVTAGNGKRLGLYASSVTTPTSSSKAIYTYNLSGKEGQTIDLRTGTYNSASGVQPYLAEGTYNLFLFSDDAYTVGAKTTVKITNGNVKTIDGTTTYLETNRKVYRYGEPIMVKAKAGNNANAWVGLYKADEYDASLPKTVAPEYILYIGSGYSGNKAGTNTDLVANSIVNKGMELTKDDYYLILMSDKNPATASVLGYLSVKVRYGVVTGDKGTYGYGEDIITNVDVYDSSDFSISNKLIGAGSSTGSYVSDATAYSGTSYMSRVYGYSAQTTAPNTSGNLSGTWLVSGDKMILQKTSGGSTYNRPYVKMDTTAKEWIYWVQPNVMPDSGSDVKIYGTLTAAAPLYSSASTSSTKLISSMPKGTPYNYLAYYNASYYKVQVGGYVGYIYYGADFKAKTNAYINQQFELHPTATAYDANRNAGFHTYTSGVSPSADTLITSYKLTSYPKATVVLQDVYNKVIEPDTYKMYAMRNSSYSSYTNKTITVKDTVTGKFANGAYEVYNLTDGFANGRVAFEIDTDASYGYVGNDNTYAIVYWAGSDGKPLAGYNAFYRVPLSQNIITFDMQPYSIIPEGASGLVAFVEYDGIEGTTGYVVDLPSGCKTYSDLDGGYTEFQVLSDTKLGHTSATQYPNNDKHYKAALVDIAKNSANSQGIIINGDVTAGGTLAQWALVESLRTEAASSSGKTVPPIYVSHGNVDDGASGVGLTAYLDFVNSHGGEVNEDKPYYSFEKNGYKFIFLQSDVSDGEVSAEQIAWLNDELADNKVNNDSKPVFVFFHFAYAGGVLGGSYSDTCDNSDDVCAVLSKYNNVYTFSGNYRAGIESHDNIFGGSLDLPVAINVGSTAGNRRNVDGAWGSWDDDSYPTYNENSNQGFYVRVYDDKVVLLGRDFNAGKWIPEACCVLENQDIYLKMDEAALALNETLPLSEYINYDFSRSLYVDSSDLSIVDVQGNGTLVPKSVGAEIPTDATIYINAVSSDTKVVTRLELPMRIFDTIDRNYYVRGNFDNWTDGVVMQKSLDDDDLVTASIDLKRGTYEFKLNNFETWYESSDVINDETEAEGIKLNSRVEKITRDTAEPANITLKALGGTYDFEYRISTNTLNIYHTFLLDEGGQSGDTSLFDKVISSEPYVFTNKETYKLGESIAVTAEGGSWVGIYAADVIDYDNTYSSYWYYVAGYEGKPLDIKTLARNGPSDRTIDPIFYTGKYKAVLFGTNDQSQILDTVYFDVVDINYNKSGNNMLSSDKQKYYYGEPIMVTGWTDRPDLEPWVCLVPRGETPNSNNLLYWYYLASGAIDRRSIPCDLINTSATNTSKAVAPGEYDLWLYRTGTYGYPEFCLPITVVNGGGTVSTNKDVYGVYEDIIVTANYKNYSHEEGSWVGIYDESVLKGKTPTNGTGLIAWYYIHYQPSYTVLMQDLVTNEYANTLTLAEAKPGEYSVYMFRDNGYSKIQDKTTFTITDSVTGSFSNGAYKIEKLYDGFANGTVVLEMDPDSFGYVDLADATVYWADANGNPLEGYTALHKQHVNKAVISFDMNSHTIIPEGAKSLVAYMSSYNGTMGTEKCVIPLPEGCMSYTGLDNGILAKFNLLTDTHLTSDDVTHYANGLEKYHSWQQDTSNEYFADVLRDIATQSPDSLGIFINGDVSNNGFAEEYAQVDNIYGAVESEFGVELPPVYVTMGNHDTYIGSNSNFVNFVNNHGGNITSEAPYYSKTIGGYKFIFLAGDNPDYYGNKTAAINSVDAELSDAQLAWLDAELKDNEENNEGKPVFLFLHQAVENTVAGSLSGQNWDGLVNADELKEVVKKYNNVMLMGGHSHWILDSPNNMYPGSSDMSVAMNLGSVSYGWTDYLNATSETVMESQGFYVQMYEDKVVFLGRNFTTDEWIPGACFVLYNEDVESIQTEAVELFVDEEADIADLIENPLERGITFTSSDKNVITVSKSGVVTAKNVGEAYVLVNVAPTNTEVLTRAKIKVKVNHFEGDVSDYYVKGEFDGWGDGLNLVHTINPDIVKASIELAQGSYEFKINNGDVWYGNTGVIEDTTETTSPGLGWEMSASEQSNCTLKAVGGTYTFSFNTKTKMLVVTFEKASEEETGEKTATIYVDYKNSSFSETPYIYVWEPERETPNKNIGKLWPGEKLEGPNAEGYYYRTFKYDESYQFIINDGEGKQTADSAVHTEEELYVIFSEGVEYTEGKPPQFWIDLNPDDDTSNIDLLYPELIEGVYYFFLPSGFNARAAEFHKTEGTTLTITRINIKDEGSTFNLLSGVNKNRSYVLGGDYSGKFMVKQSENVASVYTYTNEIIPQGTGYGDHKDDYNTKGSIMMMNADASVRLETSELKKIKGRGNSTWEASNELIGKYAFNITLSEATGLIEADSLGKKYSLVSYNTDEARMRNMVVYDLAEAIGVNYIADFEPVDFYNNGHYIGSYLLTDKIEIGDPLVDIADIDKSNEEVSANNARIYEELTEADRGFGSGTGINDVSTPGFYKYVKLDEPDATEYEQSGFLLEFEINERFADETSGFISEKGQQIVCKYPEYATYNEIQFIKNKWSQAETLIYNDKATYEELSEVMDVESFAKMYLIQELTKNLDAGATSYFVYYDGGKFHAGVAWDYDWTLGQYIESGDPNLTVDKQTMGKFDAEANKLLNDPEGWWANSKEIYPSTGVLNAQASLCQNEEFWNVVKAEWNEIFYATAMSFAVNRVTDVSELQSNFLEYYELVKGTTAMDEFKWGIIENDPLASWGSNDTGDTHDDAVVWLNNFYYDRLQWMNGELAVTDYELAQPTLKANKDAQKEESYGLGEEVILTATCRSSGELSYSFYDAQGDLIETVKSSTGKAECRFTVTEEIDGMYKVVVTSDSTTSEAEAEVRVVAKKFNFELEVEAPEKAPAGTMLTIGAIANSESDVLYYLYDEAGELIDASYEGVFDIMTSPDEAGTVAEYTVKAETEINGIKYTSEKTVAIELVKFEFSVTLTGPESVEAGMDIVLSASAKSTSIVSYTFYDAVDHTVIGKNNLGSCIFETSKEFIGQTRSFYVVAETQAFGKTFTATSPVVDVRITAITDVYKVTLYFKSTSTIGYKPMITTSGAVEDVTDEYMEKDIFICKNETETASYYWYKIDIEVSKKSPSIYFRILSSRYAMEVQGNLMVTEDKTYYFAVDNLNSGTELIDLTDATEDERNWCESALHMVYDPRYDSEESLAKVTARVDLRFVGDTTADGKVNIRDATYIQKYLADLARFNTTDREVADVDSDAKITIKDATSIQKKLAGLL